MLGQFAVSSLGPDPHEVYVGSSLARHLLEELINRLIGLEPVLCFVIEAPTEGDRTERRRALSRAVELVLLDSQEAKARVLKAGLIGVDSFGGMCAGNAVTRDALVEAGADWEPVANAAVSEGRGQ